MKKIFALLLAAAMVFSLAACSKENDRNDLPYDANDLENMLAYTETIGASMEERISKEKDALLEKLGETYDSYDKNKSLVPEFYNDTLTSGNEFYTALQALGIHYYKCVASQGLDDYDAWDGAMDDFYDAWDDAMDDFYDAWDKAYDDVYDECDELIEDGSDDLDYDDYSDVWSSMYDAHSEAWSKMYDAHSDAWSTLYDNHSDVWGGFYDGESDVDKILQEKTDDEQNNEDNEPDDGEDDNKPSADAKPVDSKEHECDDFLYVIYDDGTVEITKYTGEDTDVTIPSVLDGYPVGRIGNAAFENCTTIVNITMWPNPISIGKAAFKGCSSLVDFSIPSSVTEISESVFENCTSLETIIIWGDITSIGASAFRNCSSLTDVNIPSSCLMIGKSAFEGCTEMKSVILWGGEVIDECAFKNCAGLTEISIPSEITTIGISAFEGCTNLETVIVWGDDVTFGANAFANCPKLDKLPEGAINTNEEPTPDGNDDDNENNAEGIRPEFKEAMDSYEAFYDEYCDFLKRYKENPSDLNLLAEYTEMMQELEEMNAKFEAWGDSDLSDAELKYYLEVIDRITQKMIDAM